MPLLQAGQQPGDRLAIGLGACLNAGLLYRYLRTHQIFTPQPGWGLFSLKTVIAVAVMALVLHYAMGSADWWLAAGGQAKLAALVGLVLLGTAAYAACLFAMGFRPHQFTRAAAP